jgi:hypothetical protein
MSALDTATPRQAIRRALVYLGAGEKVMYRGESGIGKTDMAKQIAKLGGYDGFVFIRGAYRDPVDLRGIPDIAEVDGKKCTIWQIPKELPQSGRWLFIIDEFNRASSMMQNALMSLAFDGELGDYKMPEGCGVIATINPEGSMAAVGTVKMSQAADTRFRHISVVPDAESWLQWARDPAHGIEPRVYAFIKAFPTKLHVPTKGAYAFANPRGYAACANTLKRPHEQEDELALMAGCIGDVMATDLCAFFEVYASMPDIDVIKKDPHNAPIPQPHELSKLYAVTSALAYFADVASIDAICIYADRLAPEFAQYCVADACKRHDLLQHTPAITQWRINHPSWV